MKIPPATRGETGGAYFADSVSELRLRVKLRKALLNFTTRLNDVAKAGSPR